MPYDPNPKLYDQLTAEFLNCKSTKGKNMNVETNANPAAEANTPAAAPLTDEQFQALLATNPAVFVTEAEEVSEDEAVIVH